MHILHLLLSNNPVPAIYGGAVQQTVQKLSEECVKRGHKVTVISRANINNKEELENIIKNEKVNYKFVYSNDTSRKSLPRYIWKYIKLAIENGPYDVIHTHVPYAAAIFQLFRKRLGNPKIIWHVHNVPRHTYFIKNMDIKIVGISKSVISCINGNLEKTKYSVIPNICREENFPLVSEESKISAKREFGIEKSERIVSFVGRIVPEKGLHVLLKAMDFIDEELKSKITIVVAGSSWFKGAEKSEYEEHIEIKSKNNKVVWLGYIDNWELYKVYHASDVFVFPSIWKEPAGQVVLEAQSCGTKVIASNIGGIPEYLSPNENTVPPNDPKALAQAIMNFFQVGENTKSLSKERSDWVRNRFSIESITDKWMDLYLK